MADILLIQDDPLDDSDEGVFEQGENVQLDYKTACPLLRIEKYGFSENEYERQMVPKILVEIFRTAPAESLSKQLSLMMRTVMDMYNDSNLNVKIEFLENIPNLTATAIECTKRVPELNLLLGDYFLPLVVRNLGIKDNQLRKAANTSLFMLMDKGFVSRQQAEIQICPTVLALSNMQDPLDCDTIAVTLMSKLAPFLGPDVTERVFLDRFSHLCLSNLFYVRKICASSFGDFCAIIRKEAYERTLLPSYLALCEDEIWGVRKSCAEVVLSVSCACPPTKRRSVLAPVFARLLKDESRWVRMSAFQALGPFISTFADPAITNLGYSNLGELVLINFDGTEFKITPTYSETNIIRVTGDLQMLMFQENQKDMDDDDFLGLVSPIYKKVDNMCNATTYNDDNDATTYPDICEVAMYEHSDLSDNLEIEENIENLSSEEKFQMCEEENIEVESSNYGLNKDKLMKVFYQCIFDKPSNNESNGNIEIDLPNKDTDCLLNIVNKSVCTVADSSNNVNNENDKKNEELEKFNSYNYWYVSPEIPLDPNIVDSELSERADDQNGSVFMNCKESRINSGYLTKSAFVPLIGVSDITLFNNNTPSESNEKIIEEKIEIEDKITSLTEPSQYIVPQILIDHFISMTDPALASNTDNEMAYHCAYSLPAVALTLESNNWHLLKETVEDLAGNMQYKVRRTVASSLHELAGILGPDIATNDLTPIFEGFLKDLDEVRIGVLRHLADFLKLINPLKRTLYLPRLAEFLRSDNEANWRFQQELAEQLLLAVPLFHPADAAKYISTLAKDLLCHKVAAVREVSLLLVTELIRYISRDKTLSSRLLFKLAEKFAHSTRWKQRQTFALLCTHLLSSRALSPEVFASEVMPHLLDLSWDPVPNVRLVVARTISEHIIPNDYFADASNQHYDGLESVLRRLKSDKDRDVRQCATFDDC